MARDELEWWEEHKEELAERELNLSVGKGLEVTRALEAILEIEESGNQVKRASG